MGSGTDEIEREPPIAIAEVAVPVGSFKKAAFAQAPAGRQPAQGLRGNVNDPLKMVRAWVSYAPPSAFCCTFELVLRLSVSVGIGMWASRAGSAMVIAQL